MKRPTFWRAGIVLAFGTLANNLSLAQSTTDCSAITADTARLKCYDDQAARQKKKAASPPAAASTPPAGVPAATSPPASPAPGDFGLDPETARKKQAAANPQAPKPAEQVVGRVRSVVTTPRGQYRVTLEDGQVWEETQHTGGAAPEVGDSVTIKRGMLGSYFLSRSVGLALRVKRID